MSISMLCRRCFIASIVICLLASCSSTRYPTTLASLSPTKVGVLEPGHGYLLLSVTTNHLISFLQIDGPTFIKVSSDDLKTGSDYILLSLPQGQYRVSKIAKIFQFWEFEESDYLSFNVEPGSINYVGDLTLKFKSNDAFNFSFVNRSSFALQFLQDRYPTLLNTTPVLYNGFGTDKFLEFMTNNSQTSSESTSLTGGQGQ